MSKNSKSVAKEMTTYAGLVGLAIVIIIVLAVLGPVIGDIAGKIMLELAKLGAI